MTSNIAIQQIAPGEKKPPDTLASIRPSFAFHAERVLTVTGLPEGGP